MAYDLILAERIRAEMQKSLGASVEEKKMFGGVAFLLGGNMACGVHGQGMIVRIGPAKHAAAMARPHVRPFDLSGKPMAGWIVVEPEGVEAQADLQEWVAQGVKFALSLPKK